MTIEYFSIAIGALASSVGVLWLAFSKSKEGEIKSLSYQLKDLRERTLKLELQNESLKVEIAKRDVKIDNLTTAIYDLAMASKKTKKIDKILERVKKL